MIGVFDSGHGGLTVMRELVARFPQRPFVYLGDHAHAPYGERSGAEILAHTKRGCEILFARGCGVVLLGCNTASAAAARTIQQEWLPQAHPDKRVLGIIAPTVEVATQTPWSVKTPVFPQKYNTDTIALFGTTVTVESGVYETEVAKRCPHVRVVGQACPRLVPLLERGAATAELKAAVEEYVRAMLTKAGRTPEWAILGCTHYPLIAGLFRAALPAATRLLDQPLAVANALEDYLERHPGYGRQGTGNGGQAVYLTTGDVAEVGRVAEVLLGGKVAFEAA
jgi:glutamate racemase